MKLTMPRYDQAAVLVVGDVMLDRYWHGGTSRTVSYTHLDVYKRQKQTNSDSYQDNNMVENLLNSNPETENIIYIDDEDDYIDNICPNCKKTLNPDVKFCSNCGQKLV